MQSVYQLVRRVTNLNASVLITGESGTGKELIARAIHNLGSRSSRPFVAVSCGAIPETLIEAELFGHEKGAFTGTVGAREGYFEQAGDGTLFLDEIGDLSLFTQVKLLRVLQQMEFNRLGSNRLIPLRARLIFATHQDLAKLVAEGKFRQDLYYRINVMRIESPALQEHPEDIPQIAMHFLRHYSKVFQKPMEDIDPDALSLLQNYPWPGNVRELENTMQRAIILATGTTIRAEDVAAEHPGRRSERDRRCRRHRRLQSCRFIRTPASGLQDQAGGLRGARAQRQQDAGRAQPVHLARIPASADPPGGARSSLRERSSLHHGLNRYSRNRRTIATRACPMCGAGSTGYVCSL